MGLDDSNYFTVNVFFKKIFEPQHLVPGDYCSLDLGSRFFYQSGTFIELMTNYPISKVAESHYY